MENVRQTTAGRKLTLADLRKEVVGIDTTVPVLDGSQRRYIFLDNAASTPTLKPVLKSIEEFMPWYSGVHRGTGIKSLVATEMFDRAHAAIGRFVGANLNTNAVVLVKNTTEAINKLSYRMQFRQGDVVVTTQMEHHSNDLPWRRFATVVHCGVNDDGTLRLDEFKEAVKKYKGKIKLVAVTGASNITGICNPIHDLARLAHEAGAKIFVDAAQLAPHRPIDILPDDDPGHIDFIAFSAHKMYAPFGAGVLIGPMKTFEQGMPDIVGGGVVTVVTLDDVHWNAPPWREEAGSPNVLGAITLARVIDILQKVGMEAIADHEVQLLRYAYGKLKRIKKLVLYGPLENFERKVGVITFNVEGMADSLVAAVFSAEAGIGLRNGCFCAQPYVKRLLKVPPDEDERIQKMMLAGDKSDIPGMVRASIGCYNNEEDIDAFVETLERVVRGEIKGEYVLDRPSGSYFPKGFERAVESCMPPDGFAPAAAGAVYSEAS